MRNRQCENPAHGRNLSPVDFLINLQHQMGMALLHILHQRLTNTASDGLRCDKHCCQKSAFHNTDKTEKLAVFFPDPVLRVGKIRIAHQRNAVTPVTRFYKGMPQIVLSSHSSRSAGVLNVALPESWFISRMATAANHMIIHQPTCLHKGVTDCGTDKLKTTFFSALDRASEAGVDVGISLNVVACVTCG